MAVVTQTDRLKSVHTRCVIEVFCAVFEVVNCFLMFCWYKGMCHRTESDIFLFPFIHLFDSRPAIGLMIIWTSAFDDSKIPVLLFSLIAPYAIWNLFCT